MLSRFWNAFGDGECLILILQIYMPHAIKFSSSVFSTGFNSQLHMKYIYMIQQNTLEEQSMHQIHKTPHHAPNACYIYALNAHKDLNLLLP